MTDTRPRPIDSAKQLSSSPWPTTAILRLTGIDAGLPPVQATLRLAEAIHRALVRKAGNGQPVDCPELTGQTAWGQPLVGPHRHAHVLPVDVDADGTLDHIVIYAPMGLGPIARQAIRVLKTLYSTGGQAWLRLQPIASPLLDRWLCVATHHAPLHDRTSQAAADIPHRSQYLGAYDWLSATPFVPPRYLKRSGKNSLAGQVNAELSTRGYPAAEVTVLQTLVASSFDYQRHSDHAQPPQRAAYLLRLKFAQPTYGPICLGYASHFGLGLFRALGQSET